MWPFYGLIAVEFGLTVACLSLTGIAAPNLYRTKLWQDGADNNFNSSPLAGLYAAANYRPYTTPKVWSQFITNYNLVISVLSMFLMLVKGTMYMLHVLPPVVSVVLHSILIILFSVAVAYQASPDMTDPTRPQRGAAWYIMKSCSVAHDKSLVGYCLQAKATFACFVAMLGIFVIYFGLSAWSCFPSKQHRLEYEEKQRQKKLRWAPLDDDPASADSAYPQTPGLQLGLSPMTPRTTAFNKLGGTRDLPLRATEKSDAPTKTSTFALRSPGILRTPMTLGFKKADKGEKEEPQVSEQAVSPNPASGSQIYFPPPPKESSRKG